MASLIVVYWRDIPAQVIVKAGRATAKRELSKRFIEAIDRVAMREGLVATDAYLDEWRRADPVECGADLEGEAARAAEHLELATSDVELRGMVEAGGYRPRA